MAPKPEALEFVEEFQNLLIARATGAIADADRYRQLRDGLVADAQIGPRLPRFVRTCRDIHQFWQFIKYKFPSYAERRQYLWDEFRPLLQDLDEGPSPAQREATHVLQRLTADAVQEVWARALARRVDDPDGAVTSARTLLETVCKHILDDAGEAYDDGADLPKLYRLTAERLQIAPSQHTEAIFRQILGGCTAVVEGLGALRNRLSDAHGRGVGGARPMPRHAQLAVNLSGSVATFLYETWEAKKGTV